MLLIQWCCWNLEPYVPSCTHEPDFKPHQRLYLHSSVHIKGWQLHSEGINKLLIRRYHPFWGQLRSQRLDKLALCQMGSNATLSNISPTIIIFAWSSLEQNYQWRDSVYIRAVCWGLYSISLAVELIACFTAVSGHGQLLTNPDQLCLYRLLNSTPKWFDPEPWCYLTVFSTVILEG